MHLLDRIENARFLGPEFLVWLWWTSEAHEEGLELNGETTTFWLESSLVLERRTDNVEQVRMRAPTPSGDPEARMALAQGKLPVLAGLRLTQGDLEWGFSFRADTFTLTGVKVPEELKDKTEESLLERMQLTEELEAIFLSLYQLFLDVRLTRGWDAAVVPAIREWIDSGEAPTPDAWHALRGRAMAA